MSDSYLQSADRNLRSPKFYSTAQSGREAYNPKITVYYGSDNNMVRVEEVWRGDTCAQTISGSNYVQQWPNYTYTETFYPWQEV
jgi:hypothetical protein